jgi:hypothetical protein
MDQLTSLQVLHIGVCSRKFRLPISLAEANFERISGMYPAVISSLKEICTLVLLTQLTIIIPSSQTEKKCYNISQLTNLKLLQLHLRIKTLPAKLAYRCMQLQELDLCTPLLQYLPKSFTGSGAFPNLITLKLSCYDLVEFPEVDEGVLCKLRTLNLTSCFELATFPLSLELLTNLKSLIIVKCKDELKNSCRKNWQISSRWRSFDIHLDRMQNNRRYTFSDHPVTIRHMGNPPLTHFDFIEGQNYRSAILNPTTISY